MVRGKRLGGAIVVLLVAACAAASPVSAQSCGGLLQPACPPPPPPPATNPDGSLNVSSANPYGLAPLPAPQPGQPLYARTNGRLAFGLSDNALNEDPPAATNTEIGGIARAVGASMVRIDMYWPGIEYDRDKYAWTRYDNQYRALVAAGLRPFWIIAYTPKHAAKPGPACPGPGANYCDREPDSTAAAQAELHQFGADLARRYPLAAGFEYRNEPNLDRVKSCSWDPSWHVPPAEYTANLTTFAAGVRSTRPAMRIIGGALSNCTNWDRVNKYLDAMLAAGAGDVMDAVSWHPYDNTDPNSDFFADEVNAFSAVLRARGEQDVRIVASEVGMSAAPATQSAVLTSQYSRLDGRDPGLDLAGNYDAFIGFVSVDWPNGEYGFVRRKDALGAFQAERVYCDFRTLIGAGRPLPSYVRDCII